MFPSLGTPVLSSRRSGGSFLGFRAYSLFPEARKTMKH